MPESEQQAVRRIFTEGAQGGAPVTVNGEPLAQVMQLPKLPNEEAAQRMARILKEKGKAGLGEDEYNRRIRQLKEFRKENPAPVQATISPEEKFFADNLDTTPVGSALEERRRRRAVMSPTGFDPAQLRSTDRFTPESREGRIASAEAKGIDTTTGFGDLSESFGLAVQFNSPQRQAQYIAAVATDNLQAQGINLPAGTPPVRMNEELGQLEYLRPTADGKVRWTLVNSEIIRPEDIASLADLPEVLSAVGATVGAGTTRHPIIAEFLGDVVGRNTGMVIEAMIAGGEVGIDEVTEALSVKQSVIDTAFSRGLQFGTDRLFGGGRGNIAKSTIDPAANQARRAANVEQAARAQEFVEGEFILTPGAATDDAIRLQFEADQFTSLPASSKRQVQANRLANRTALRDTSDRIANNASRLDSPTYEPLRIADEAAETVNRARIAQSAEVQEFGKIGVVNNPNLTGVQAPVYSFTGDNAAGLEVVYRPNQGTAQVQLSEVGPDFRGTGSLLYERAARDAADNGLRLVSDSSVSDDALQLWAKLDDLGYGVKRNPRAEAIEGQVVVPAGQSVFEVTTIPGDAQVLRETMTDNYSRELLEAGLERQNQLYDGLVANAESAKAGVDNIIGWNPQTQRSGFLVNNSPGNNLNKQIRQLNNRAQQALTETAASPADRLLGDLTRRSTEEGETVLAGLSQPELDLGQLLVARSELRKIADQTGDADISQTIQSIDSMLRSSRVRGIDGEAMTREQRRTFLDALKGQQEATELAERTYEDIASQSLFKTNSRGEFVNSNPQALDRLTNNGSNFITNMKPALDAAPDVKQEVRNFLWDKYGETVLADGFNGRAHANFMTRKEEALRTVFSEEEFQRISNVPGFFRERINKSTERLETLRARVAKANSVDPKTIKLNNKNILGSLNNMTGAQRFNFLRDLRANDPGLHDELMDVALKQNQQKINKIYFGEGTDKTTAGKAEEFDLLVKNNKELWRDLFGVQYVADMEKLVSANRIDARLNKIRAIPEDAQPGWLRMTRSFIGPLSKPQRIITAATWNQRRLLARTALNAIADPDKLRLITQAKGISITSRQGIALMSRLGFLDAMGLSADDPQIASKVQGIVREQLALEAEERESLGTE